MDTGSDVIWFSFSNGSRRSYIMGKKHDKKRFFIVKYVMKPDNKFDEFVELSKKKVGAGKIAEAKKGSSRQKCKSCECFSRLRKKLS